MGERRKGSRIPVKDLPELLKKFEVDLGTGELLMSSTVDANRSGISLSVPIHIYKVKNYDITLYSLDGSFSIKDEIVYIKGITPEESRISIMFSSSSGLDKYNELLDSVSHHL
ncbi:MAG: hypothetical protein KAQ93_08995 [Spirochaetales bacterium]|nr:hypothetical protein [Spirochaetales bacterium]